MNALVNALTARLENLDRVQWMSYQDIINYQFQQLPYLAEHCAAYSPHFAERLRKTGLSLSQFCKPEGFTKLSLLSRRELQEAGDSLFCNTTPENHGAVHHAHSSGSTGEPVTVCKTGLNQLNWLASNLLDHVWHKRDFSKRLCAIRSNIRTYTEQHSWGVPADLLFKTGPALGLPITTDIKQLATWIFDFQPDNLLIYPSTLDALTQHCLKSSITFKGLKHIRTLGETLSSENRQRAASYFNAKIEDVYSCEEIGLIALECPSSGLYHVNAENVLVEVLKENGEPCKPLEVGRIVITDLHNFATPLIRYDIGDYAEVGDSCPCGRGLPTLNKIYGRERNMIVMPNGDRHWPLMGIMRLRGVLPILQFQLIQEACQTIEVRLVVARPLRDDEENQLCFSIQQALGFPFYLRLTYFEERIPLGPNGKFEEFICRIQ